MESPPDKPELIDQERKENLTCYHENEERLKLLENIEKWAVIAHGKLTIGTYDKTKNIGLNTANHRFFFEIKPPQEKVKGTFRRPLQPKTTNFTE